MKKMMFSLLVLSSVMAVAAPIPADYNVTVHVVGSKSLPCLMLGVWRNTCTQHLTVVIDGKKYELDGDSHGASPGVLVLGDYKAKVTEVHRNDYDLLRTYQFLLPDGKTRNYDLSGILE